MARSSCARSHQTEIAKYGLTNAQFSAGINNVALGEPVYLDAMVTASIAPSNIVGVTWLLPTNNIPVGSQAVLLTSPLGTNVPLYKMADRYGPTYAPVYQLAGRTFFRPDVVGTYTVLATITTSRRQHRPGHDEHRSDHFGGHLSWR